MQQLSRLLLGHLDRHKSHRRTLNRLANRFRIGGIVLIALHVRAFTYCVGISRTSCPRAPSSRAHYWAVAHASSPTTERGSRLKKPSTWLRRSRLRKTVVPSASMP